MNHLVPLLDCRLSALRGRWLLFQKSGLVDNRVAGQVRPARPVCKGRRGNFLLSLLMNLREF